jgi:hypothetical protein
VKIRFKKIQIYLVIAIFLNILFPDFIHHYDLTKDSFFLSIVIFENPDQETVSSDYLDRSIVFETNSFSIIFPPVVNLFDPYKIPLSKYLSPDQETFLLRC